MRIQQCRRSHILLSHHVLNSCQREFQLFGFRREGNKQPVLHRAWTRWNGLDVNPFNGVRRRMRLQIQHHQLHQKLRIANRQRQTQNPLVRIQRDTHFMRRPTPCLQPPANLVQQPGQHKVQRLKHGDRVFEFHHFLEPQRLLIRVDRPGPRAPRELVQPHASLSKAL